jgi:hypothetical protein
MHASTSFATSVKPNETAQVRSAAGAWYVRRTDRSSFSPPHWQWLLSGSVSAQLITPHAQWHACKLHTSWSWNNGEQRWYRCQCVFGNAMQAAKGKFPLPSEYYALFSPALHRPSSRDVPAPASCTSVLMAGPVP